MPERREKCFLLEREDTEEEEPTPGVKAEEAPPLAVSQTQVLHLEIVARVRLGCAEACVVGSRQRLAARGAHAQAV